MILIFCFFCRLFRKYIKILQNYSEYEKKTHTSLSSLTYLTREDIYSIWKYLSKEKSDIFIQLYIHCGQLYHLGNDQFFSPHNLPCLPNNILFDQYPSWYIDDVHYITRCFSFVSLHDSHFCTLLSFIHRLVLDFNVPQRRLYLRSIYQYCLDIELVEIYKTNEGEIENVINYARILFDYSRCSIILYAGSAGRHQLFCILAEGLEGLFSGDISFERPTNESVHVCFLFFVFTFFLKGVLLTFLNP